METLKTPSEYSVDFNRGFQGFSMANLEKGISECQTVWICMCGSRGGGRGSGPPLNNRKNIGFLSNTGLDPLKITKMPSQHSMLGHRHLNGFSLAGR